MTPRSPLDVRTRDGETTERRRPAGASGRRFGAMLVAAIVGAGVSPAAAQTTTLSGTTTGTVLVSGSTGSPTIEGDSVLIGQVIFRYDGEGSSSAHGTMTGNLSGSNGSLRFDGPSGSSLAITGTHTYSGDTSVTGGGLLEVATGGLIDHALYDLRVGADTGDGTFSLSGGKVAVQSAVIGAVGNEGTLLVTSGSMTAGGTLTVAAGGAKGFVEISGGSLVTSSATVGTGDDESLPNDGRVTVSGGEWTTTNDLTIGGSMDSYGSVTVTGGTVNTGSTVIDGLTSAVTIKGGLWTNSGDFDATYGTLTVGSQGASAGTLAVGGALGDGSGFGTILVSSGGTIRIGLGADSGSVSALAIDNSGTVVFDRTGSVQVSTAIAGSGALVKQGSGEVVLSSPGNDFTGGTSIDGGVLTLGDGGALGASGTISFGGGTLRFTLNNANDYSGRFADSDGQTFKLDTNGRDVTLGDAIAPGKNSTLEKLGSGNLILAADNTYTGATTVSEGTLRIGAGGRSGAIAGNLVTNAEVVFDRSDATGYSGAISGNGTVVQGGAGTLTLTGANTYSGGTRLDGGTLALGSAGAIGSSGTISFAGGALQYSSQNATDYSGRFSTADNQAYKIDTAGRNVTFAGNLTSTGGTLEKLGGGTLSLTGTNTYDGTTTLTGGTLSLGSATALDGGGAIAFGGGTLRFTSQNRIDYSGRFDNADGSLYRIDTNGQTVSFGSPLAGATASLVKLGSGTLALGSEFNSFEGGVTLAGGSLQLDALGALGGSGPIEFAGGTLLFTGSNTFDYSGRISAATGQDFRIDTNYQQVEFGTALGGAGNTFTKLGGGSLTFAADNTYTGVTTVSEGVLRIGNGGTSGAVAGDIVTNATVVFDRSDVPSYSGQISGTGAVAMEGSGMLILGGTNTYTGGTMLLGGTISLASEGAIGTSGPISFNGGTLRYTPANNATDYSGRISSSGGDAIRIDTNGESVTYLHGLAGAGTTLEKIGSGTLTLSAASSYDSGTTVGGGTLEVSSSGAISHAGADLVVGTDTGDGTLLVGGAVTVGDATLGRDAGSTGAITVDGGSFTSTGTLRVGSGDTGTFTVNSGTVTTAATTIGDGNGFGMATVSGGRWTNSGDLAVGNGTLTIASGTVAVGGTLSASNVTQIDLRDGAVLRIGTGGSGGVLAADLDFAGALVFDRSGSSSYGGNLSGAGTVTKAGSGLLTLTSAGTYTYTGTTTVSAGGLVVDGALDNSSVEVGSGGRLGGGGRSRTS